MMGFVKPAARRTLEALIAYHPSHRDALAIQRSERANLPQVVVADIDERAVEYGGGLCAQFQRASLSDPGSLL